METPVVTRGKTRGATGLKPTAGGVFLLVQYVCVCVCVCVKVLAFLDSLTDKRTLETVSTKTHNTRSKTGTKLNVYTLPHVPCMIGCSLDMHIFHFHCQS